MYCSLWRWWFMCVLVSNIHFFYQCTGVQEVVALMPCVRMVNSAPVSQAMVLTLSLGANQVLTVMRIISIFKQIQENVSKVYRNWIYIFWRFLKSTNQYCILGLLNFLKVPGCVRKCGLHAYCDAPNRKCVCRPGYVGNAYVRCRHSE